MAATEFTRRRFVTRAMVEDAHRAGQSLTLGPRDVITVESQPQTFTAFGATSGGASATAVKAAIRAAVVAELGTDDPRIDAAIDRVFARRGL